MQKQTKRGMIVLGPTAVGKTALSLLLAERNRCEIVSLDSMQIYRGMDIGTAKPNAVERQRVRHHLIDYQAVTEHSDAAKVLARARAVEEEIVGRGAVPLYVGGTAMYIKLYVDGLFEGPAADAAIRGELMGIAEEHGSAHLHEHSLKPVDPATAARVHPNDLRRIVRAIEVYRSTGVAMSAQQTQWSEQLRETPYVLIGLDMAREELYRVIDERVDAMMAAGLEEEVRRLKKEGIEGNPTASQAIGYKELLAYLRGEYGIDEAVRLVKRNTRRFAKHQMTWFRRDERIRWFTVTGGSTDGHGRARTDTVGGRGSTDGHGRAWTDTAGLADAVGAVWREMSGIH